MIQDTGVLRQFSSPYNPAQNGKIERAQRTILEMLKTQIKSSDFPASFWPYLAVTCAHQYNRNIHSTTNLTPYEALFGTKPVVNYMRPIGIHVIYRPLSDNSGKLEAIGKRGKLLGYHSSSPTYAVWDVDERRVAYATKIVPRDVSIDKSLQRKTELQSPSITQALQQRNELQNSHDEVHTANSEDQYNQAQEEEIITGSSTDQSTITIERRPIKLHAINC